MISPPCGSWIGAGDLAGDAPRMRGHPSPSGLLGTAAGVRTAVEPAARGALVDLPRPLRDRAAQPRGVAAGVLHLVGIRRSVDATVRQPAGRQPGPAPAAKLARTFAADGGVLEHLPKVEILVQLFQLAGAGRRDRLLERVGERPRLHLIARVRAITFAAIGLSPAFTGSSGLASSAVARWGVRLADDSPVLAGRLVEPFELAVSDPHEPAVQVVERAEVVLAQHHPPQLAQPVQIGGVDDPVVGASVQVDGGACCEIACQWLTSGRELEHLFGEGGEDHVSDRRLQRAADEPPAQRVGREFADAVRLHPRLFEQPPVHRELPVGGIVGLRERDVVFDRPALGVLGVERLVQRDPEAA